MRFSFKMIQLQLFNILIELQNEQLNAEQKTSK